MSLADRYGLTLSTSSAVAAEHYQDGMDALLSYGFGADAGVRRGPGGPTRASPWRMRARRSSPCSRATARPREGHRRPGARLVAGATRREQQHVEALAAIVGGETARGLGLIEEHVKEFPRDALLVNQAGEHASA